MPAERYYYNGQLKHHQTVILTDQEFHHLAHVMRASVDDEIELVNGNGQLASARIAQLRKHEAHLEIRDVSSTPSPTRQVILAQATPRPNRLDYIIEKCTELGMTDLWLFPGKLSERKNLMPSHIERMNTLSIAAMKQCGRLYLPKIELKDSIGKWKLPKNCIGYFGDVDPNALWLFEELKKVSGEKNILFVTGPESGFTDDEVAALKSMGLTGVKLNENILRTDTASIAALSLITHLVRGT